MYHSFQPKLKFRQRSIPLGNGEVASAGKDPLVCFFETDAAVAFCCSGQFRHFDGELEGSAVAIAVVGFEFWGRCGV